MELNLTVNFVFSVIATIAFSIMLNSPRKCLLWQGLIGALGWCSFMVLRKEMGMTSFYANFVATLCLSLASEMCARLFKQPTTVFVIPGIIPLAPGLGMYQGMEIIIQNHYNAGMTVLMTAITDAGAIALGVMMMTSIFRVLKLDRVTDQMAELIPKKK